MSVPHTKYATTGFVVDLGAIIVTQQSGDKVVAPGAREAISSLQEKKVPFVIVSRGTKETKKGVARDLSRHLSLPIKPRSLVLPQSPFRDFVGEYEDKVILVVGGQGEKARKLALEYGFQHVMTCRDIAEIYDESYGKMDEPPSSNTEWKSRLGKDTTIAAIFVWWSSDDWDQDMQICIDLMLSDGGRVGTHSKKNIRILKRRPDQQPQLFICMADTALQHGQTAAPVRSGGKTWLDTLSDRWTAETGERLLPLPYSYCGMGCDSVTLNYADKALHDCNRRLNGPPDRRPFFPRTVYTIGADIQFGADSDGQPALYARDARRRSIRLDGTGRAVHDFHPVFRPWHVAASLGEAVEYALTEEYWECVEAGLKPLFGKPESANTSAV